MYQFKSFEDLAILHAYIDCLNFYTFLKYMLMYVVPKILFTFA